MFVVQKSHNKGSWAVYPNTQVINFSEWVGCWFACVRRFQLEILVLMASSKHRFSRKNCSVDITCRLLMLCTLQLMEVYRMLPFQNPV